MWSTTWWDVTHFMMSHWRVLYPCWAEVDWKYSTLGCPFLTIHSYPSIFNDTAVQFGTSLISWSHPWHIFGELVSPWRNYDPTAVQYLSTRLNWEVMSWPYQVLVQSPIYWVFARHTLLSKMGRRWWQTCAEWYMFYIVNPVCLSLTSDFLNRSGRSGPARSAREPS